MCFVCELFTEEKKFNGFKYDIYISVDYVYLGCPPKWVFWKQDELIQIFYEKQMNQYTIYASIYGYRMLDTLIAYIHACI